MALQEPLTAELNVGKGLRLLTIARTVTGKHDIRKGLEPEIAVIALIHVCGNGLGKDLPVRKRVLLTQSLFWILKGLVDAAHAGNHRLPFCRLYGY